MKGVPDCVLGILSKEKRDNYELNALVEYLEGFCDFKLYANRLGKTALMQLASEFVLEEYGPGDTLFNQGDPSDQVYLIVQGQVNLLRTWGNLKKLVSIAIKGKILGDRGILRKENRSLTAVSSQHSVVLALASDKFQGILRNTVYRYFEQKLQFIEKFFPVLNGCSLLHKEKLAYAMETRKLKKNQLVVRENERMDSAYYIAKGQCAVTSRIGNRLVDRLYLTVGSAIGEENILFTAKSKYTVRACTESVKLYKLTRNDYFAIMPDEFLHSNQQAAKAKQRERDTLISDNSLPSFLWSPTHKGGAHINIFASQNARKTMNELYTRSYYNTPTDNNHNSDCKRRLEKLRDITVSRFYKFNSPYSTVKKRAVQHRGAKSVVDYHSKLLSN